MNTATDSILDPALCKCGHPFFSHYDTASQPCSKCYCEKYEPAQPPNTHHINHET